MKSLIQYINEARDKKYKNFYDGPEFYDDEMWDLGYKYYNEDTEFPTLEEMESAFSAKDRDDNPSFGAIVGMFFNKVDEDRWSVTDGLHGLMGRSFTNEQILDRIKDTKDQWFLMLRKND